MMFKGRHFDQSVILLCVRWYLAYGLSLRNLKEMMAERPEIPQQASRLLPCENLQQNLSD